MSPGAERIVQAANEEAERQVRRWEDATGFQLTRIQREALISLMSESFLRGRQNGIAALAASVAA